MRLKRFTGSGVSPHVEDEATEQESIEGPWLLTFEGPADVAP
jgi:hypothetical protein